MDDDAQFQAYMHQHMKPDTDHDFVRRNYAALKAAYQRNGSVKFPVRVDDLVVVDRNAELD